MIYGAGDEISIVVALVFTVLGLVLNPANRSAARTIVLLASGLSFGALLLVIVSPFSQLISKFLHTDINLLEIAVKEGKLSLWWAGVVASLYLVRDIFFTPDA